MNNLNVEIQPLKVEINVIKVGNKQMTQSIFKQLRSRNFIKVETENGIVGKDGRNVCNLAIDGNAWGWVNYKLGLTSTHVVYTKDGVLYRSSFGRYVDEDGERQDVNAQKVKQYCREFNLAGDISDSEIRSAVSRINSTIIDLGQLFIAV